MNVTLPDGTVLKDIPEGTTKAQLIERLARNGYDVSKLSAPPKGPDAFDQKIRAEAEAPGGILVNLGAGINNVVQGVKQLAGRGETDAQIDERRAMNERASGGTLGNQLIQGVGEMLPTMVIPGVGIGGVAAKAALPRALGAAAEIAPGVGTRLLPKKAMAVGAGLGAGQTLLNPTKSDESIAVPAAIGGTIGAVLPGAGHLAGKAYDRFSASANPAAVRAWNALRNKLGAEEMGRVSGEVASPHAATLPAMTTAAMADSAPVAALERGAREATPNVRNLVDLPRNQAAFDRIMANTVDPDAVAALRTETTQNVQNANQAMKKPVNARTMRNALANLEAEVAKLTKSDEFAVNRTVRDAVAKVEQALMDPGVNPARLSLLIEELRPLNEKAGAAFGPRISELQMKLREAVEAATGGLQSLKQGVLAADQQSVDAAAAAAALRGKFMSPEGVPLGKRIGDTPVITDRELRGAMSPDLDPMVRDEMNVLADALRRSELHAPQNSPGPSGLDLTQPLSVLSTGSQNPLRWIPGIPGLSQLTTGRANESTTKAANNMLLHPEEWINVENALQYLRNKPLGYGAKATQSAINWPGQFLGTKLGDD